MIKKTAYWAALACFALSCSSNPSREEVSTDTDVAKAFIRSTLDNNMKEAEKYLLNDPENTQLLQNYSRWYGNQPQTKTDGFKKADIFIKNIETVVNDSLEIIYYSNSVEQDVKNKLKLVRVNGKWLIDFKYTLSGNL